MMHGLTVEERRVLVAAGTYETAAGPVEVVRAAAFEIAPADTVLVEDEPIKLGSQEPRSWGSGRRLAAIRTTAVNAYGAYAPGSLVIRTSPGGDALEEGKDYLVSPDFGMVGIGPDSAVGPDDTVYASYRHGLLRLDAVHVDGEGTPILVRGTPDLTLPLPPQPAPGHVALANVFRPYHAEDLHPGHVFPVLETPDRAATRTTPGRIPKTLAKLRNREPVMIVCWGDSVTVGGDVSTGSMKFVEQFRRMLLDAFPFNTPFNIVNMSYGGSNSSLWLRLPPHTQEWFERNPAYPAAQVDFDRIVALEPDLVAIEFVNDAGLDEDGVERVYGEIVKRLEPFGTELILITPHFTAPWMMPLESLRDPENRAYVEALHAFADRHNVAVADASARWEHLWKQGVPYITLLTNSINHPDDRGHAFFAEELMKCFE